MIDLYFWTTPNGMKPLLFLEETGLECRIRPVNISKGEQFEPEFLKVSPNNRIPAIVDHKPAGNGPAPLAQFESGAILVYLAEKTGKLLPEDAAGRAEVLQWLFWQMGGIGPMFGQYLHFADYAPEKLPYAVERYSREAERLLGVLDRRLADREFVRHRRLTRVANTIVIVVNEQVQRRPTRAPLPSRAPPAPATRPSATAPHRRAAAPLLGVLDRRLADRGFVAGAYSIADIAIYPWVRRILDRFDGFGHVGRWARRIADRPATKRAYAIGAAINTKPTITEESKALLLGTTGEKAT